MVVRNSYHQLGITVESGSSQPGIAEGRLLELLYLSFIAGEPENSEVPGLSVISRVSHLQQGDYNSGGLESTCFS